MRRTLAAFVMCVMTTPAIAFAQTPFAEESIRKVVNREAVRLSVLAVPAAQPQQPHEPSCPDRFGRPSVSSLEEEPLVNSWELTFQPCR